MAPLRFLWGQRNARTVRGVAQDPLTPNHPCWGAEPPCLEQEGILEAEARCTLQGRRQALTPAAFLAPPPFKSQDMESWGANTWGRGVVKAPQGCCQLLPQPPAKAQGAPCQRLLCHSQRREKQSQCHQKKPKPGTCQISPFPQRGTFCPHTTTLLHLLSDELDGIFILHPTLDQGQRDKDGSAERQKQWLSLPSHTAQRLTPKI